MTAVATGRLLHTAEEAAELLGNVVTANWLKRRAGAGLIPHTRLGRFVRFSEDDLLELIAQNRCDPAAYGRKKRR